MNYLIKNAIIIHQASPYNGKKKDIFVREGIIESIGKDITPKGKFTTIQGKALKVCIGLCDIGTHTGEPGHEHRETIHSLTSAALKGGYTALAIFPNNAPITQSKSDIFHLSQHADRQGVHLYPIGALSVDTKGANIAEYIDMSSAGAVAFSDGMKPIQDSGLLSRALIYARQIDRLIINHPSDKSLASGGEMHEGAMSTSLGMKGVPSIAEMSSLQRDLLILSDTGGRLLEHCLSTEGAVSAIKIAKKNTQGLTASVAYMNLIHTDEDMADFDTNLKVEPVLRGKADRKALIKGVNDGVIDAIVSNHTPLDEEVKNLEFSYAEAGATGLETCLPLLLHHLSSEVDLSVIINALTVGPRKILGLPIPDISEGAKVDLCVFDTEEKTPFTLHNRASLSKNNPYLGNEWKGRVVATIL